MIIRDSTSVSLPIKFDFGHPDGDVEWELYGQGAVPLISGVISVEPDEVSTVVSIDGTHNELGVGEFFDWRELRWSYEVSGEFVTGQVHYDIEASVPFGASSAGVRTKIGISPQDLPDDEISLVRGYLSLARMAGGAATLTAVTDPLGKLEIRDAIEASAALSIFDTLQLRIAQKEASETNQFQRFKVNWELLRLALEATVARGLLVVNVEFDPLNDVGALFILGPPAVDAFTGSES